MTCTLCGGKIARDGACDDCGAAVINVGGRAFPGERQPVHLGPALALLGFDGRVVLTIAGRVLQARLDAYRPALALDLGELFKHGDQEQIERAIELGVQAREATDDAAPAPRSAGEAENLRELHELESRREATRSSTGLRPGMLEVTVEDPPAQGGAS